MTHHHGLADLQHKLAVKQFQSKFVAASFKGYQEARAQFQASPRHIQWFEDIPRAKISRWEHLSVLLLSSECLAGPCWVCSRSPLEIGLQWHDSCRWRPDVEMMLGLGKSSNIKSICRKIAEGGWYFCKSVAARGINFWKRSFGARKEVVLALPELQNCWCIHEHTVFRYIISVYACVAWGVFALLEEYLVNMVWIVKSHQITTCILV